MTVRHDSKRPTAVVVGGGLAGITAALRLAEADHRVTLVESRPRLGGLAFSFRRGELTVDNGQHVFLRCCTAYRGLIDRLGAGRLVDLQPRLDVPVLGVSADGRRTLGRLRRAGLPVPLHLAGSLATYPHLSAADRLRVVRAALALKLLDLDDPALDEISFGDWLRRQGQNAATLAAMWDLVGVATLNATADQTSLALAAMVFKTGLLSDPGASDIGMANVPLGAIHHDAARAELERAGVRVLLRARAVELKSAEQHAVRLDGGELLTADTVVLAGAQESAAALLPAGSIDRQERLAELGHAPILNVHVVYDRKLLRQPFFAALGSPVQWVFDRTQHSGLAVPGAQYLALSQSAVQDEIELPVAELRARYLPELERLLPAAKGAEVLDFFVTRERTATFAPAPGTAPLRPAARTNVPGLLLAGSWTATGWPATMESAVRSGHAAADAALTVGRRPVDRGDGRWPR
ncbi:MULTISPECIES: hydroxysqualene dehydroxylase HpnE [unclassified Kitasatospora]|uniref:hydroxysqualene dehydroxylase HpnE n=1 Tax=unclassified Kitasatospora TaxID=2633591 RepID=UPI0007104F36|nr:MULTISPECIES: hydroxysqualene dehydroxylase HpnE [unclassified Kitasatospora]KQV13314.1 phytoene dehydrogenase [Kitasatospora sp. Root107]KRB75238.1 phytoene dehydrogenase [Kitasatospora sp. Root187]